MIQNNSIDLSCYQEHFLYPLSYSCLKNLPSSGFRFFMDFNRDIQKNDKDLFRFSSADFSRNRKTSIPFVMDVMISSRNLSSKNDLRNALKQLGIQESEIEENYSMDHTTKPIKQKPGYGDPGYKEDKKKVSRQAFNKARLKLNPAGIRTMNIRAAAGYYRLFPDKLKKFHGYFRFAIDGSDIIVPCTEENEEVFGVTKNGKTDDKNPCMAKMSSLYDAVNGFYIDMELASCKFSERELARNHLEKLKEEFEDLQTPILVEHDRGYFSLDLLDWYYFTDNIECLFRLKSNDLKVYQNQVKPGESKIFTLKFSTAETNQYRDNIKLRQRLMSTEYKVRICKYTVDNPATGKQEEVCLLTTVLDDIPDEEWADSYWGRWPIEESYDQVKNTLGLEDFSSPTPQLIEQDVYVTWTVYNLISALIIDAQEIYPVNQDNYKDEQKVNRSFAAGALKDDYLEIMVETDRNRKAILEQKLMMDIMDNVIPDRLGRHYDRDKYSRNKKPINNKRNF